MADRAIAQRRSWSGLPGAETGAALLEFALVLPTFLTMLTGIIGYGGYFWRAHALQ